MTQAANIIDKKRIVKNTIFLFIRMIIVVLVNFIAVRLVLKQLGVDDYGIYSLIMGFIGLFCIVSQGMGTMLQRFFCYEIGLGNKEKLPQIFTIGVILTALYAIVLVLWSETGGMWLLLHKLKIPSESLSEAKVVFQFVLLTMVAQIFFIPYTALIIAYERMSFFAKISIVDASCKFFSVVVLIWSREKLICYPIFLFISALIVLSCYALYCHLTIPSCRFTRANSKELWRGMASFVSWNILESSGNLIRTNGTGLVLNAFCVMAYNATWNISGQIRNVTSLLYNNILSAATPQILKSYTAADKEPFYELLCSTARYAFILLWIVCYPLLLKMEFLLQLWLGNNMPPEIATFSRFGLILVLIDTLFCSLWIASQANGKVMRCQVEYFLFCIIVLFGIWSIMRLGATPKMMIIFYSLSNFANLFIRLFYVVRCYQFSFKRYISEVIRPTFLLSGITSFFGLLVSYIINNSIFNITAVTVCVIIINPLLAFFVALSHRERAWIITKSLSLYRTKFKIQN